MPLNMSAFYINNHCSLDCIDLIESLLMKLQLLILIFSLGNVLSASIDSSGTDKNPTQEVALISRCEAFLTLCKLQAVRYHSQILKTEYPEETFQSDLVAQNSLNKYWKEMLKKFVMKSYYFNELTTSEIVMEFKEFKNFGETVDKIGKILRDYHREPKVSCLKRRFSHLFRRYHLFAEMIAFTARLMSSRTKFVNQILVNQINDRLGTVTKSVLETLASIKGTTRQLLGYIDNKNFIEAKELTRNYPSYYRTFVTTQKELGEIAALMEELIEKNPPYQVRTMDDSEYYVEEQRKKYIDIDWMEAFLDWNEKSDGKKKQKNEQEKRQEKRQEIRQEIRHENRLGQEHFGLHDLSRFEVHSDRTGHKHKHKRGHGHGHRHGYEEELSPEEQEARAEMWGEVAYWNLFPQEAMEQAYYNHPFTQIGDAIGQAAGVPPNPPPVVESQGCFCCPDDNSSDNNGCEFCNEDIGQCLGKSFCWLVCCPCKSVQCCCDKGCDISYFCEELGREL